MRCPATPRFAAILTAAAISAFLLTTPPGWAGGQPPEPIVVHIAGMACPFCTYGVQKSLAAVPGVKDVHVSLGKSEATLDLEPGTKVSDAQIQEAIRQAGFSPGQIERQ